MSLVFRQINFFLGVVAGMLSFCAVNAKPADPGWQNEQFFHESNLRQFRYYVPTEIAATHAVVILFHDGGQNMNWVLSEGAYASNRWLDLAESEGFILVVPNGSNLKTGQGRGQNLYWNDCRPDTKSGSRRSTSDDVEFIRKVMERVQENAGFDPTRIYATGSGEGGLMAFRMAFEAPDLIAAIAVSNCALLQNSNCERKKVPIPMMVTNGTEDEVFLWIGGAIKKRDGFSIAIPKMKNYLTGYNRVNRELAEKIELADREPSDQCTVQRQFFPGFEGGADLCFLTLEGGGHVDPSIQYPVSKSHLRKYGNQCLDIEMAVEAWHFLSAYSLDQKIRPVRF